MAHESSSCEISGKNTITYGILLITEEGFASETHYGVLTLPCVPCYARVKKPETDY